jgi:putative transposase
MRTLKSQGRSKYLLLVHLIFVVKYRKKLLIRYGNEVKQKMLETSTRYQFEIDTIEVDQNHIHLLVAYEPRISISQIVSVLKGQTTYHLWHNHNYELKKQFWKHNVFWSSRKCITRSHTTIH